MICYLICLALAVVLIWLVALFSASRLERPEATADLDIDEDDGS